ncbi:MAG: hypothetical protein WBB07_15650 [Mycobacterium sp.]
MQISARSYLTAGVSLTAATAIALTPLAIPANDHAVTIPNVTISDIQLTVTPADIQEFFTNLQTQLSGFNESIADLVSLPGAAVSDVLAITIDLTDNLYASLRGATSNATLIALFDALQASSNTGLGSLLYASEGVTGTVWFTTDDVLNLVSSAITGSLSNVLSAVVAVANNPLTFANYAGLLTSGVASGQLVINNGLGLVETVGNAGFELAQIGVSTVGLQINNVVTTVRDLMDVGAGATGLEIIEAFNTAVQAIVIAPIQLGLDIPFWVSDLTFGYRQLGWDEIFGGLISTTPGDLGVVNILGNSIQGAITSIGSNPLDLTNYVLATGALIAGGFDSFNRTVETTADVAQLPFMLGVDLYDPNPGAGAISLTSAITGLNTEIAQAISGVLAALNMPESVYNLPLVIAAQYNSVINASAEYTVQALVFGQDLIQDGAGIVIGVSDAIRNAILGDQSGVDPGAGISALSAPAETAALKSAPAGSEGPSAAAVVNEDDDDADADATDGVTDEAPVEKPEAPAADDVDATDDDVDAADDDVDAADDDADASEDSTGSTKSGSTKSGSSSTGSDSDASDSGSSSSGSSSKSERASKSSARESKKSASSE